MALPCWRISLAAANLGESRGAFDQDAIEGGRATPVTEALLSGFSAQRLVSRIVCQGSGMFVRTEGASREPRESVPESLGLNSRLQGSEQEQRVGYRTWGWETLLVLFHISLISFPSPALDPSRLLCCSLNTRSWPLFPRLCTVLCLELASLGYSLYSSPLKYLTERSLTTLWKRTTLIYPLHVLLLCNTNFLQLYSAVCLFVFSLVIVCLPQ